MIGHPEYWCKEANALDPAGNPINGESDTACKWCAGEAIEQSGGFNSEETRLAMQALANAIHEQSNVYNPTRAVIHFNDNINTSHGMVMDKFDEAIQRVERAGVGNRYCF